MSEHISILSPTGFKAGAVHSGLKSKNEDIGVIFSEVRSSAAAVYTKNKVCAAPITVTKEHLKDGFAQAIVVNSGCANACTGEEGMKNAREMAEITASELNIKPEDVIIASTGVIGHQLPMNKIKSGIKGACSNLSDNDDGPISRSIITTDLVTKTAFAQTEIDGKKISVGGIGKGSGMVHPNMATMLIFLTTDAKVHPSTLRTIVKKACDKTFNRITVDGDTSTNDMASILANGKADNEELNFSINPDKTQKLLDAVTEVCKKLSIMIAKDGEGATKLIKIICKGADTEKDAETVAKTIATGNLFKTAIFGGDPNWGRIFARIGMTEAIFKVEDVDIYLGKVAVLEKGTPTMFDRTAAEKAVAGPDVEITVNLNAGDGEATVYTCDFSYDYVKINAEYHT